MKKQIYFVFFALLLFLIGGFASTNDIVHAEMPDGVRLDGLEIALYDSTANSTPLENTSSVYNLAFDNNFDENSQISTTNNPYGTYYIGITVNTQPIYDGLSVDDKLRIFREITANISINGSKVVFSNGEANNEGNYMLYAPESPEYYQDSKIFIRITPIKAGTMPISCTINDITTQMTLNLMYATPSVVTLECDEALLNQLFESYNPVTFTAVLNYQEWLDPTKQYTFDWTLNTQPVSGQNSQTLTIEKDMIAVGDYIVAVTVPGTTLQASKKLTIITEQDYPVTVTHSSQLEFTLGETLTPVSFTATIPVQDDYAVNWYLKTPDSVFYQYQTTSSALNFNTMQYDAGEYKVLAIVRYQDKDYYSKIYTIKINPAEMTEEYDFTVDIIEYSNEYTGLTGYQFSIDVQQHFLNNQIVWFVRDDTGTSRRQTGFTFNFQPTEIKNYVITVFSQVGSQLTPLTKTGQSITPRRIGNTVNIWTYVAIAVSVILVVGIASIIISNKAREKIW